MDGNVFIDTNILLRAVLTQMTQHSQVDVLLKRTLRDETELWISGQIIREFIVQATHPRTLGQPLTTEQAVHEIQEAKPIFSIADENELVRDVLLDLLQKYPIRGKQVHDANIVATMLAYGIDTLLTLNVDDFKRFQDDIKIVTLEEDTP